MDIQKIKSRLTKLLALSASPNEAEAALAMEKCQELMKKYNIRTIDIDEENRTANVGSESVEGFNTRAATWEKNLAAGIAKCFDGTCIIDRRGTKWMAVFIAGKTEVDIITDLYKRTRRIVSRMSKYYADYRTGNKVSIRHNYSMGMVNTIYERLKNLQKSTETPTTTALVPIMHDAVDQKVKDIFGKVRTSHNRTKLRDRDAFMQGKADGHSVNLHKSVNGDNTGRIGATA